MPEEIPSQSQARKRKERKKKGKDSLDKVGYKKEDDESTKMFKAIRDDDDDDDEGVEDLDHGSHSTTGGILSTAVFLILLGGLVLLTALIYIELKDSKQVGPTITDSRYASYLEGLVEDSEVGEEDEHLEHYDAPAFRTHEDDEGVGDHLDAYISPEVQKASDDIVHETEEELGVSNSADDNEEFDLHQVVDVDSELVIEDQQEEIESQPLRDEFEMDKTDGGEFVHANEFIAAETLRFDEDQSNGIKNNEVEEPGNNVEEPGNSVEEPENSVEEPGNSVEESGNSVEEPGNNVEEPGNDVEEPHDIDANDASNDVLPEEAKNSERETDTKSVEENSAATDYDERLHEELREAQEQMEKSLENALRMYEGILVRYPLSITAQYGRTQCLDQLSEQKKSNSLLDECIRSCWTLLQMPNIPLGLFRSAAERCADRMKFRGYTSKAADVEKILLQKFPNDIKLQNRLAVTYLHMGNNDEAKKVLEQVLKLRPDDGFAKVHYGFILKTSENLNKEAIKYLSEGISTGEEGTIDGRFFFHLGDALSREGHVEQAYKVYEDGVNKGLFLSIYQRSLYNEDQLTGRPWWTPEQTTYQHHLKLIESHWEKIRQEALNLLNEKKTSFVPESEGLRDTGEWKQFELFARGRKVANNCVRAPFTCQLVEGIKSAAGCTRGQIKFSLMHPGTHVWSHTGPTNCRLRAHLGLVVPDGVRIRVANETRTWSEGKFIIFDDSFEHEVFHEGTSIRLVLIVDFWHPELTDYQRRTLTPI